MKSYSTAYANEISAPCRSLRAEFISAHEHSYSSDYISSITIEAPQIDGKFFGYSISHKAKVVLLRNASRTPFTKGDWFTVKLGTTSQLMEFPKFYIDSIQEDSKTGEITLEGYDNVYSMNNYTFKDLNYGSTFTKTISQIISDIGTLLGVTITNNGLNLTKEYTQTTLNVAEDTPIRSLITNIAEVTGTILVNSGASGDNLKFIKLGSTSSLSITKSHYFESEAGTTTTLTSLASVNALGDTVQVGTTGYTQVIQDNAFLTNLDDSEISTILTTILNGVVKTVCSYTLDWIGNPALEYGDLITIDSKDSTITTNYLSINLQYNGGLKESISWQPNSETTATAAVNTSINSAISKTEAKVDKANKEITLTVAEISEAKGQYTTLKQKLDSIELEAGTGNVTFRQDTVPTDTSTRALLTGDLWFNTGASGYTNNKWYRYNGSTWDVLTDGELATATSNITNLTITTNGLSTSVQSLNTNVDGLDSRMETAESTIEQQAGQIALKASQASVTELTTVVNGKADSSTVTEIESRVTSAELDIDGLEGEINLKVAKDGVISAINLSSESATISANKVNLNGYVTVTDLSTSGFTTINGDNITTGTINADLITTGTLDASNVNITNLNANNITSGTINASDITITNINADNITSGTIDASNVNITNLNANNITSGTIDTNRINTTEIFNKDSLELKVEDKGYTGTITVSIPAYVVYWFPESSDGWHESNNGGVRNSFAIAQASFTTNMPNTKITFEVYSDAELNNDYLEVSKLDTELSVNIEADSDIYLTKSYRYYRYTKDSPDIVQIDVPTAGPHFVEFKFVKDNSIDTAPDKAGFRLITNYPSSYISLSYGGIDIGASQSLHINGMVTFSDLESTGSTVINGSNITTGELSADRIIGGTIKASEINLGDISTQGVQITENGELSTNGGFIRADLITINNSGTIMSSTEVQSNNLIANNNIIAHTSINTPKLVLDDDNGHYSSAYPFASTSTSTTYYIWLVPESVPAPTPTQPTNWSFRLQCTTNGESYNQSERVAFPRNETFNVTAVFTNVTSPSLHLYKSWSSTIYAGQMSSDSHAENNIDAGYYFDPSISTKVLPRTITSGITEYGFCIQDNLLPYDNNSWNIGSTNLKWDTIYARVGTIQTSDRNEKKYIEAIDDKYSQLFDKLNPVTYKFNDGHRTHVGLIAQEVEQALTEVGIDSEDFAGFIKDTKTDGSDSYGLRYDEFISILIKEVQNLKQEVERLKNGNMG